MNRQVTICIIYFIFVSVFYTAALQNDTQNPGLRSFQNSESEFVQRKWISQLFLEGNLRFQMDPVNNTECKKDFNLYLLHLKNQSMWAVKMMESSEWPLHGILSGTVDHMGNYDECLSISSYDVHGKYCLVEATYHSSDPLKSEFVDVPDEKISAWEVVNMFEKNPTRINRKKLRFAVCIPSSCEPIDLKTSLENTLSPIFKSHRVDISINVDPIFCQTRADFAYPIGFYITSLIFISLCLFVIWSTLYDMATSAAVTKENNNDERKNRSFKNVSEIFSMARNFKKLITTNDKDTAALYFPKVVSMLHVILMHRFMYSIVVSTSNAFGVEQVYRGPISLFLARTAPVDVFFFVSGFLMFDSELEPVKKGGKAILFSNALLRWIRTIPAYGVLILYVIYILPYTGDGPLYNRNMLTESDHCKESWWVALLTIYNVVKGDRICIISSWYIPADFQLSIIGGILLYIYTKHEKIGISAIVLTFMASIFTAFFTTYVNQLYGVLGSILESFKDLRTNREATHLYATFSSRAAPYLMGFICKFLITLLKERNFKFTNKQTYILLLVFGLVSEGAQMYGSVFFKFGRTYNRFERAFFAASNRILFVSFYFVFYCAYFTSGLGIFNKMVEWKGWIIWGRLSFSVYLLGLLIQLYHISSQREPILFSGLINVIWWYVGDIILIHSIALIFYLFVEAPILNLRTKLKLKLSRKPEELVDDTCKKSKFVETSYKKGN